MKNDIKNEQEIDNVNKEKKIKLVIFSIIAVCLIIVGIYFATAKYSTQIGGFANAITAKPILKIDVTPYEAGENLINPYCVVTVKNYDENDKTTGTAINYELVVKDENGNELSSDLYFWTDGDETTTGNVIEGAATGSFGVGTKQEDKFRIIFINKETEATTKKIQISANIVQK